MDSGIYMIKNIINDKKYIGSAINIKKRWYQHKHTLNKNTHDNSHLQNAWNKYGKENFNFILIEITDQLNLIVREQYYIDFYNVIECGYNLSPTAGNTFGFKFSKESKLKMSLAKKGKKSVRGTYNMSNETKKKISEANKGKGIGRKHTKETKKKMSDWHKNKKVSDETKKKISEWRKGNRVSDKTNKKITNKLKNKLLEFNIINKTKKINKNNTYKKGHKCSNITKNKISKSNIGKNYGENNGMSITNKNEVRAIRLDYINKYSISDLMFKYNKKYMFIYKIVKRLTWNWLDNSSFSD